MSNKKRSELMQQLADIHKQQGKFIIAFDDAMLNGERTEDVAEQLRVGLAELGLYLFKFKGLEYGVCNRAEFEAEGGIIVSDTEFDEAKALLDDDPKQMAQYLKNKSQPN
jgi:hypothetical protein|uniref:Uncharacterized protein n=1 Tax=Myoviridae sp. ctshb19 TaxID=2825194 RepID=A0A8S5UGP1_9CAUD|nr:MAG TPA: hypothetical protein [Myoviridae sp. ctshb19]